MSTNQIDLRGFLANFHQVGNEGLKMASSSIKSEDRLEGASNFNAWKARVLNILEESDLDDLDARVVEEPTTNHFRLSKR